MFVCVCVSDVEGLFDREDDVFDLRQAVVLQDFGIWHGDVNARHPGGRGVQVVESRTWKHTQEVYNCILVPLNSQMFSNLTAKRKKFLTGLDAWKKNKNIFNGSCMS